MRSCTIGNKIQQNCFCILYWGDSLERNCEKVSFRRLRHNFHFRHLLKSPWYVKNKFIRNWRSLMVVFVQLGCIYFSRFICTFYCWNGSIILSLISNVKLKNRKFFSSMRINRFEKSTTIFFIQNVFQIIFFFLF